MADKKEERKVRQDNVLAEGEATGHAHRVHGEGATVFADDNNNAIELSAPHGVEVTHEEHKAFVLPKGDYEIKKVQELDPFAAALQNVRD